MEAALVAKGMEAPMLTGQALAVLVAQGLGSARWVHEVKV